MMSAENSIIYSYCVIFSFHVAMIPKVHFSNNMFISNSQGKGFLSI